MVKKCFKPKYGVRKLPTSHAKADWLTTSAVLPFNRPI